MVLPNFIICGAAKAGTTALYHFLKQHPNVYMPDRKEPQFFYNYTSYRKGIERFSRLHFSDWCGEKGIGTCCTEYMWRAVVPERIAQHLPQTRLIFTLRNPIDRIYSHYNFMVRKGYHNPLREFSNELRRSGSRLNTEMIYRGMYHVHLKRYKRYFAADQMKIILYDDFRNEPMQVLREIFRFIDVDVSYTPYVSQEHNTSRYPNNYSLFKHLLGGLFYARKMLRSRFFSMSEPLVKKLRQSFYETQRTPPEMSPADRAYLREIYREPNRRLAEYLGRDLSHWT